MRNKDELSHIGLTEIFNERRKVKAELMDIKYMEKKRKDYLKLLDESIKAKRYTKPKLRRFF